MALTVEIPESAAEVAALLGDDDVVLAGGTELMPRLTTRTTDVSRLVCLRHAGLAGIKVNGGRAVVGAATTLTQLGRDERLAVLRSVMESIASPTIRNLATVGGNLFVRQPYGDLAVALLALDAEVSVEGSSGTARPHPGRGGARRRAPSTRPGLDPGSRPDRAGQCPTPVPRFSARSTSHRWRR